MIDLWPEYIGTDSAELEESQAMILKKQGALLGTKTANVVEGKVSTTAGMYSPNRNRFDYTFYIVGPVIRNYRYRLLTISQTFDFYPLDIYATEDVVTELPDDMKRSGKMLDDKLVLVADSELRFMEILRAIFATKKVRKVIESIISQSCIDFEL